VKVSTLLRRKTKITPLLDDAEIQALKLELIRLQQIIFHTKKRAVIVLEGFDAAGKGTCIRHLTQGLDPRSIRVVPIGAPTSEEREQHYLQRFWKALPQKGNITVFDRSWYGRVLVEKVEALAAPKRLQAAYEEINQFEAMLRADDFVVIKFFLVVSKDEQLKRFKARLADPFKQWKLTDEDIRNRRKWKAYVSAADEMIKRCPGWTLVPSDSKAYARICLLQQTVKELRCYAPLARDWKPSKLKLPKGI